MTTPLPVGFRLELDATSKQLRDGLWFGGSPPRVIRLTGPGRAAWGELHRHGVVDRRTGVLARRLVDAGIAHPVPPAGHSAAVTIVVPAYERADDLDRCLAALGTTHPVVVVDDASADAVRVATVCTDHGATLVRREVNGGPGPARNTGLEHVRTPVVAFVDSDCVPPRGWLEPLLAHLADPLVAAVAPRVTALAGDTWAGRYTRERSSLDLGEQPARVAPRTRVAYVPTAALVVRRSALDELGTAFDETLRVGEDVDLIWRLHAAGKRVRYDPSVQVPHREPADWPALLGRRFRYGTSAGPLARRHRGALTPLVLHPWPTLAVTAALARRPVVAGAAAMAGAAATARTLHTADVPTTGLLPAMGRAVQQTFLGVGRYATQFATPLLIAALPKRQLRFAALALLLAPPMSAWTASRRRLDPLRYAVGAIADEVAYGAGVWTGCARARTAAPLRPVVIWRPLRIDARRS
ncbi:MAG TPA: mycofactocin biosynthesis glycosyltransferase MftF [Jatrophihabitans sp.]|jgi:mycofactocin system glycosyltransferase